MAAGLKTINLTLPVFNEARILEKSVADILSCLRSFDLAFEICIVDNGSVDETLELAKRLASAYSQLSVKSFLKPGRGRAIKTSWLSSDAEIRCYMDIDLSTELSCLADLLSPLITEEADISIGSRHLSNSAVVRSLKRELISRINVSATNFLTGLALTDFQCGFKACSRNAVEKLLPITQDNDWFFDTELLVYASYYGFRIHQEPVRWKEDPDSRVKIISTAIHNLRGLFRIRRWINEQSFLMK